MKPRSRTEKLVIPKWCKNTDDLLEHQWCCCKCGIKYGIKYQVGDGKHIHSLCNNCYCKQKIKEAKP